MKSTSTSCPRCQSVMRRVAGPPDRWVCPKCDARFAARPQKAAAVPAVEPAAESSSRSWLPLLLIPVVVVVLVGALIVVHQLRSHPATEPVATATNETPPSGTRPTDSDNSQTQSHLLTVPDNSRDPVPSRRTPPVAREPSSTAPAPEKINSAIDRGVAYLKTHLTGDRAGRAVLNARAISLVGLALLECGVPPSDPAVQQLAARVRASARPTPTRTRTGPKSANKAAARGAPALHITYDVSLAIWFLDRLGEAKDQDLIRSLALQLIAAQTINGGWDYNCPHLSESEGQRLLRLLREPPPSSSTGRVPPAVRYQPGKPLTFGPGRDDNSLTQFAILALWAARKHGVPVERSLSMVEQRFRMTQDSSGCWGYVRPANAAGRARPGAKAPRAAPVARPDSMTCAGLLGLAVGRGLGDQSASSRTENKDEAIKKAILYLAHSVGKKPLTTPMAGRRRLLGVRSHGDLYYLWSLERMAVVYGLSTIAGVDWYAWGSSLLVTSQNADGSWSDVFPGVIDTCFALLFLKRANIVKDLTKQLEMLGPITDVSGEEISKGLAPVPPEDPAEAELGTSGEMTKELTPASPDAKPRP